MYVSDKLVYLELEKTGSTHVIRMLRKIEKGGVKEGKHNRISTELLASGRTIMGSIRNPWDWYVSQWGFGCESQGGLFLRQTRVGFSGYGMREHPSFALRSIVHQPFKKIAKWKYLYEDIRDPKRFRAWLYCMFDEKRRHDIGNGYGQSGLSSFSGYLTYSYLYLYSRHLQGLYGNQMQDLASVQRFDKQQNILDITIKNESLNEDLVQAVKTLGITFSSKDKEELTSAFRTNQSARDRDCSFYYDQASVELVAQREAFILDKYAYQQPELHKRSVT